MAEEEHDRAVPSGTHVSSGIPKAPSLNLPASGESKDQLPQDPAAVAVESLPKSSTNDDCGCDPPPSSATAGSVDNGKASAVTTDVNAIPTSAELSKAGQLPLLDADGKTHTFKSIYGDASVDRHLIIFIRHFFCTICQEYLRSLSAGMPSSSIASLNPSTKLTIIGCGSPTLIRSYVKETSLPFPIYTDPSAALYRFFGLGRTLDMGSTKPAYLANKSTWQTVIAGVSQSLRAGTKIHKGGDWWQIGGEFLFVKGATDGDWDVQWCHRMKNTRDHAEVAELKNMLGM